jgi:hypothetical protein
MAPPADAMVAPLAAALSLKDAGNQMFQQRDFSKFESQHNAAGISQLTAHSAHDTSQ